MNIQPLHHFFRRLPVLISFLAVVLLLMEQGIDFDNRTVAVFHFVYTVTAFVGVIALIPRYISSSARPSWSTLPFDLILLSFLINIVLAITSDSNGVKPFPFSLPTGLYVSVLLVFIREFSALNINIRTAHINPAQLFVFSFLFLVLTGSLLLLLPNATTGSISYLDALFTATSAVCVTGLTVVDTGTSFTLFGQIILLVLIQSGGLGIMTFASYFSFFFRGSSSYEQQLLVREMTNAERLSEVFSVLKKIILITLLIELVGAVLIFIQLDESQFVSFNDTLFFSVFHSVSAFCNAGFSTLGANLYEPAYRSNYPFHLVISGLIILGGIGFPIVLNLLRYLKVKMIRFFVIVFHLRRQIYFPRILNLNTRIVLITTTILLVSGTVFFFLFENSSGFSGQSLPGKLVSAFFCSVTARTAGFNTIDMSSLSVSSILLLLFLMWVGASPGSTGGGIKTSTLAIALLNVFSIVKGKSRVDIFSREVSALSISRAFAVMLLSVLVIFSSVVLLSITDPSVKLIHLVFESVSAYSTVGLSLGVTSGLSTAGKLILILTMFIGRVGMLSLLIALIKKSGSEWHQYPEENLMIN